MFSEQDDSYLYTIINCLIALLFIHLLFYVRITLAWSLNIHVLRMTFIYSDNVWIQISEFSYPKGN